MKSRLHLAAATAAVLLAAGFAALNVLAFRHARSMLVYAPSGARTDKPENLSPSAKLRVLFSGIVLPRPDDSRPPSSLSPSARLLSIPAPGGVRLCAWYADRGPDAPLVLFFHGYSTDKTRLLPEARAILEAGASVLLVDFRGSGGSSESYATLGWLEAEDVAAAVAFARSDLPSSSLFLYGQSMGSAAILRAVQAFGVDPDGVVLESVFDSMLRTVRNRFASMGVPSFPAAELLVFWGGRRFGFDGFANNPVDFAPALRRPALFLHGALDPRAAPADARRTFDAVSGPKQFVLFPDSAHDSYFARHPGPWRNAVLPFLRLPLRPAPPHPPVDGFSTGG